MVVLCVTLVVLIGKEIVASCIVQQPNTTILQPRNFLAIICVEQY